MKTLLLLRHAKSSWENPDLSDFDRPLNSRGLETAPIMGNAIYKNNLQPDFIISSPAKRAKQTAILIKEMAQIKVPVQYDERIYEASPISLFHIVGEIDTRYEMVLLVGHNPGLEGFIKALSGEFQSMPTGALAKIHLNIDHWDEIVADCGGLDFVIRPKDEIKGIETLS